jgi:hypothetical protein
MRQRYGSKLLSPRPHPPPRVGTVAEVGDLVVLVLVEDIMEQVEAEVEPDLGIRR